MDGPGVGRLLDQDTLATCVDSGKSHWIGAHWRTFSEALRGERTESPFPCFFGAESVRWGVEGDGSGSSICSPRTTSSSPKSVRPPSPATTPSPGAS